MLSSTNGFDNARLLLPQHLRDVEGSGLKEETIRQKQLFSIDDPVKIAAILGWRSARKLGACLGFSYFDLEGNRLHEFCRLKPHHPVRHRKKNGELSKNPAKYESPLGSGNHAYFAVRDFAILKARPC
jgi:hypothetical protein